MVTANVGRFKVANTIFKHSFHNFKVEGYYLCRALLLYDFLSVQWLPKKMQKSAYLIW